MTRRNSPAPRTTTDFRYSVVIPTKDRTAIALRTVDDLALQTRPPDRVIIVDAAATPLAAPAEIRERLLAAGSELVVRSAPPSTSGQRNVGIDLVETPLIMFMDDDVWLPPNYAEVLLERWERDGLDAYAGMVGALSGNPVPSGLGDRVYRWAFMLHYYDPSSSGSRFRLSQKLRYNDAATEEVELESTSTMAVVYRTDLARKHRFDERFTGYVLGEDHDFASRARRDGPILLVPSVQFVHIREPGERGSTNRWYDRGRKEAYFRLRRLEPSLAARAAFALSVVGELAGAAADAVREREPAHLRRYVGGLCETVADIRTERSRTLSLKPATYYRVNHAYRRVRITLAERRGLAAIERDGIRIVGFHRVTLARDPLAVEPARFRRQLEWLLESGLRPIRIDEALDLLTSPVAGSWFAITFDDGYHDNLEHAVPILEDLGIPATIYVPSAIADRTADLSWYRRPPRTLTWDELRALAQGGLVDVQAHTRTHPILTRLPLEEARREIAGSRSDIAERLGVEPTSLAYPAGIYGQREVMLAREAGFRGAITTRSGLNVGGEGLYELRRTLVLTGDTFDDFRAKVAGALDKESFAERLIRKRRASGAG